MVVVPSKGLPLPEALEQIRDDCTANPAQTVPQYVVFKPQKRRGVAATVLTLLALSALPLTAQAQTWTGAGGNSNWGTAGNWNPATVPNDVNTATATFVSGVANLTATLDANYAVNSLVFNQSGGGASSAFTIGGANTLTVGSGGITNNTDAAQTINARLALNADATFSNTTSSGSLVLGGVTLSLGTAMLTVSGAGTTSIASVISGTGTLNKTGTRTLTLTGPNTYTGLTTISNGTVNVGVIGGSGTTASLGTGGTYNYFGGSLNFYAGSSAGSGILYNVGFVRFNNTSDAGTSTITNNNGLIFNDTSTAGTSTITNNGGATLDISGLTSTGISIGSLSGAGGVTLGDKALTVGGLNTSDTISGVLSGSGGSLTKTGTGTLTLSGANTYTGATTISAGSLVASGSALGTGAASIASGATLDVGQAVNTSGTALAGGAQTLSVSSLTVTSTSNTTTPALTFNLFGGGVSDTLTLTNAGTDLTFSSATSDKFIVGFASGTGSVLPYGQIYTLMTFTSPSASDVLGLDTTNANNSFAAKGVGNLASTTGTFSWTKNGSNQITSLQYNLTNDATTPEPGSLALLLTAAIPLAGAVVRERQRRKTL